MRVPAPGGIGLPMAASLRQGDYAKTHGARVWRQHPRASLYRSFLPPLSRQVPLHVPWGYFCALCGQGWRSKATGPVDGRCKGT